MTAYQQESYGHPMTLAPALYVVATPIGNLDDITIRALHVLENATCIAAEDTRHSGRLLAHHGISNKLISLHEHNEQQRIPALLSAIRDGGSVALISDAGTPLVSDPGYRLVREVARQGIEVLTVPGPSALTAALSVSGVPTDRFWFEGFLPQKKTARLKRLASLANLGGSIVVFESAHRILASLADMAHVLGPNRNAAVCRELTKRYETVLRGTLEELTELVGENSDHRKGEFVVIVEGALDHGAGMDGLALAQALLEDLPASKAARIAARISGESRRELYAQLESAGRS